MKMSKDFKGSVAMKNPLYVKAYNAFNNAKQRCTNPKHKDYPKYGGLGVKMLFATFDDFIGHIGLPPNSNVSLDRIDPTGNYEIGNVRWANKIVQAHNKKNSPTATYLSLQAQISIAQDAKKAREQRERLAQCWWAFVSAICRGTFSQKEVALIADQMLPFKCFSAGWELGQVRDLWDPEAFFHMPSLTQIGECVRILGGPFGAARSQQHDGVIPRLPPHGLVGGAKEIAQRVTGCEKGGEKLGVAFFGGKSEHWLKLGGLEGIMMVCASRYLSKGKNAAAFPMMILLDWLKDLGAPYLWHEVPSTLLDCPKLFIPDFQIDYGAAMEPTPAEWSLLAKLIDYRIEYGKLTYVGIQNHNKVPHYVLKKLLGEYDICELPEMPDVPPMEDFTSKAPIIAKALGFSDLKSASYAKVKLKV